MSQNSDSHPDLREIRGRIEQVLASRQDEIYDTVRRCVAEVLEIDLSKVSATAELIGDLGAESLDFLDLVFRLEGAYRIKIQRDRIRSTMSDGLAGGFEKNGLLTEEALERLRILMPEVNPARIQLGLSSRRIPELFTVQTFVNLVAWSLVEEKTQVEG